MRKPLIVVSIALLLGGAAGAWAQDAKPAEDYYDSLSPGERASALAAEKARQRALKANPPSVPGRNARGGPMPPGVIKYDTGTFSTLPTLPVVGGSFINFAIGNRFNTANGNPCPLPLTVSSAAFWPALVDSATTGTGAVFMSIYGPGNTGAGTAAWIDDQNQLNVSAQVWNTRAFTGGVGVFTGTGNASFQVGIWNPGNASTTTTLPCATDCVGLDTSGTTMGQGYHGMMVQDINGNSYMTFNTFNALVRPIGTNVPVELMNFEVE